MKSDYYIERVPKSAIKDLLYTHHYLKDISKDFRSGYNYALYKKSFTDVLNIGGAVGAIVFTGIPVPEIAVSAFGLAREDQDGLFELSRLCIHPGVQAEEYNITSWFVSKAIKQFRKDIKVRAILSYADGQFHKGVIYAASNFKYYGMTSANVADFWILNDDGTYTKKSRGGGKGLKGEYRKRSQKHRFLMVFDKSLKVLWKEEKWTNPQTVHPTPTGE